MVSHYYGLCVGGISPGPGGGGKGYSPHPHPPRTFHGVGGGGFFPLKYLSRRRPENAAPPGHEGVGGWERNGLGEGGLCSSQNLNLNFHQNRLLKTQKNWPNLAILVMIRGNKIGLFNMRPYIKSEPSKRVHVSQKGSEFSSN